MVCDVVLVVEEGVEAAPLLGSTRLTNPFFDKLEGGDGFPVSRDAKNGVFAPADDDDRKGDQEVRDFGSLVLLSFSLGSLVDSAAEDDDGAVAKRATKTATATTISKQDRTNKPSRGNNQQHGVERKFMCCVCKQKRSRHRTLPLFRFCDKARVQQSMRFCCSTIYHYHPPCTYRIGHVLGPVVMAAIF